MMRNYKEGKEDGISSEWYENRQLRWKENWNEGKLTSSVVWKPNGDKCTLSNVKNGNGLVIYYGDDGVELRRFAYRDGERIETLQQMLGSKETTERILNALNNENDLKIRHEVDYESDQFKQALDEVRRLRESPEQLQSDALSGEVEKLSSSQEKEGGALPEQQPSVAFDSQRQVAPPPSQLALQSSTTGSSEKIRTLAKNHYFGRESAPDYERAFALFTHLANAGDAEAARYLGVAYLRGKGVSKDSVKALQWFRVASQRGDALAAKNVRMLTTTPEFDEAMPEANDKEAQQLVPIRAEDEAKAQTKQIGLDYHTIILNAVDQGDMGDNYTGWGKSMDNDGQIANLVQYKNGKRDGLSFYWHKNGQKLQEGNYKEGKRDGFQTYWFEDGLISSRSIFRDGKIMSGVSWKPNGEKCPVTKIDEEGNGVVVHYYVIEGEYPELYRETYKAGEPILELPPLTTPSP